MLLFFCQVIHSSEFRRWRVALTAWLSPLLIVVGVLSVDYSQYGAVYAAGETVEDAICWLKLVLRGNVFFFRF